MLRNKFRGKFDRAAVIAETVGGRAGGQGRPASPRSASTRRTGRGPTTGSSPSSRWRPRRPAPTGCATATRSAATHPAGSGSGSPSWPARSACRSRRTATTTSAWPWPTRSPARSATSTPARTPGSTPASTGSASGPATPTCSRRSWRCSNGFGLDGRVEIGDPLDLSWARRFAFWAAYAFGQPLADQPAGRGAQRVRARVGHPRRRRAQGPPQLRVVRRGRARPVPGRLAHAAPGGWC